MAEVIGFVAGKGGMGKTAMCAAVAEELASLGKRVLCIDCQAVYGDLDAYLRLEPMPHLTYAEVCRGVFPLEKASAHPVLSKLRFLAAPATQVQEDPAAFAALLRQALMQFDYILLDDPQAYMSADRYLLVTAADPAAIRGARRKADALEVQGKPNVRLLVNRIDPKVLQALELTVDDVMDQVGLPLLGIVPEDQGVMFACAKGKHAHSKKTGAFAAAERIARRITGQTVAIPARVL